MLKFYLATTMLVILPGMIYLWHAKMTAYDDLARVNTSGAPVQKEGNQESKKQDVNVLKGTGQNSSDIDCVSSDPSDFIDIAALRADGYRIILEKISEVNTVAFVNGELFTVCGKTTAVEYQFTDFSKAPSFLEYRNYLALNNWSNLRINVNNLGNTVTITPANGDGLTEGQEIYVKSDGKAVQFFMVQYFTHSITFPDPSGNHPFLSECPCSEEYRFFLSRAVPIEELVSK